jgi:hypothetical protein
MGFCSALRKLLTLSLYVAGVSLSGYALFVETSKAKDVNYVALCEISPKMNCTRVLMSKVTTVQLWFGVVVSIILQLHLSAVELLIWALSYTVIVVPIHGALQCISLSIFH